MSTLKWSQRSSSAIIGAFLQTVFLFFSGPTTRCFLNSKKRRSLSEGLKYDVYHLTNPFGSILLWILQRQTS